MPRQGGQGRNRKKFGQGPGGKCVCPNCGTETEHKRGVPCYQEKCPKCGTTMSRKFDE